jgi:hypothetical protein
MSTTNTEICETCKFWAQQEDSWGLCRRHPPQIFEDKEYRDTYACWPDTSRYSWCGEYKSLNITKE